MKMKQKFSFETIKSVIGITLKLDTVSRGNGVVQGQLAEIDGHSCSTGTANQICRGLIAVSIIRQNLLLNDTFRKLLRLPLLKIIVALIVVDTYLFKNYTFEFARIKNINTVQQYSQVSVNEM